MRRIFRSTPYFLPPDGEAVADLFAEFGVLRRLQKGEWVKREGAKARVFYLTKGLCAYELAAAEKSTLISIIAPGRALGDLTAGPANRCNVRTVALTASEVLEIPAQTWSEAIDSRAGFARATIATSIAKEESIVEGLATNLTLSPQARLKVFLKAGFAAAGLAPEGRFPFVLSGETMARAVNLNRVTVAKIVAAWQDAGLVRRSGRALVIDPALFNDVFDWLDEDKTDELSSVKG